MQRKLKWLFVVAVVGVTAYAAGAVLATPPVGVTGIPLAQGHFGEIDAKTLSSSWQPGSIQRASLISTCSRTRSRQA